MCADRLPTTVPASEPERREPTLLRYLKRGYLSILRRAVKESLDDHITSLSAALAYYAFLAIPSALLVGLGLFSLFASPDTIQTIVDKLGTIMPKEAVALVNDSLTQMLQRDSTSVTLVVVGGLLAVWALGGAMQHVMWALNIAYDREETRSFLRRLVTSWAMLLFALLGFALSFGLLVLGPALSRWLGKALDAETLTSALWFTAQWPLVIGGLFVALAGIYWLGPNVERPRFRLFTYGSVVAVAIWLLASAGFAAYVSSFSSYNKSWGTLAGVVIMLTWLWLGGVALLFGAEINAEVEKGSVLREAEPAEVEPQPRA
jgi:membrane protein